METLTPVSGRPVRRRRSAGFWAGLVLLVAGVVLLGWVGWQLYGTNWVAEREQRTITADLEQRWDAGERPARRTEGVAGAILRVPRFGSDYAVPVLEGIATDTLARGIGHFPEAVQPGQRGNYALAAHRVTHGQPFRRLGELRPGDEIVVETATRTFTYVLDTDPNDVIVPFTSSWVLDRQPRNPDGGPEPVRSSQRLITLTTCSELFHTDDRMIAFGHLVSAEPK